MVILLVVIDGYSIDDYFTINYCWILGYIIIDYW
jgi:hypothetical protein